MSSIPLSNGYLMISIQPNSDSRPRIVLERVSHDRGCRSSERGRCALFKRLALAARTVRPQSTASIISFIAVVARAPSSGVSGPV
jgi:hypothetical protein